MENVEFLSNAASVDIRDKGYSVLPPLPEAVCSGLKEYYVGLSNPFDKGFHPSMFWTDPALKAEISQKICSAIEDYLKEHFANYRLLYGNFMVKQPGVESDMKLHQDWAYVDEPKYESYAIWFPLDDLTKENGALSMIPGSHKFRNTVRGPGVYCPFQDNQDMIIKQYGVPLYLKRGEPALWQHRVLHYSPPNLSDSPRIGVTAIIVPNGVPVYHFFKAEQDEMIEQYIVENGFYFDYVIGQRPAKYVSLYNKIKVENRGLNVSEIASVLGEKELNKSTRKWWQIFK